MLQVDVFQSSLPTPRNPVTCFANGAVRFPGSADSMNAFSFRSKWVVTAFISLCVNCGELFLLLMTPGSTGEKMTSDRG